MHRAHAQTQAPRDLFVRQPTRRLAQHLQLALGEQRPRASVTLSHAPPGRLEQRARGDLRRQHPFAACDRADRGGKLGT